jgi:DNA polymerase-3 subunit beta
MEFAVEHRKLLGALQVVMRAVATKSTIPVLTAVKLSASDGKLALEGTDFSLFLKKEIPADVKVSGETLLPGRFLFDFMRRALTDTVCFEEKGEALVIRAGNARVETRTMEDAGAFPVPDYPDATSGKTFEISPVTLQALLAQVVFAAERENIRPMLNSVYFRARGGEIVAVATDGKRMAVAKTAGPDGIEFEALLPRRSAEELSRILDDSYGEESGQTMRAAISPKVAAFTVGGTQLTTSLVTGQYVPWENVIPGKEKLACSAVVARDALLATAQQAELVAEETVRKIKVLQLRAADGQVVVRSESSQIGCFESNVPAEVQGEISISLDVDFLLDSLANLPGKNVAFGFLGPDNRVLIQPADREYPLHVVMPVVRNGN